MDDAKQVWDWWQSLLVEYGEDFTRPGWFRFVQWVTGTVLCGEEHTITQILVGVGQQEQWRSAEHFAEYGAWNRTCVEQSNVRVIEERARPRWGGCHPVAIDDTKVHRSSPSVWGACTLHESTARSPNRAETVRVHDWVVAGTLLCGRPWTFLPHSARLYFRKEQRPAGEPFRKNTELAVELLRQCRADAGAAVVGVFDGAYAMSTVVRACLEPPPGQPRIEVVTRLRRDARL